VKVTCSNTHEGLERGVLLYVYVCVCQLSVLWRILGIQVSKLFVGIAVGYIYELWNLTTLFFMRCFLLSSSFLIYICLCECAILHWHSYIAHWFLTVICAATMGKKVYTLVMLPLYRDSGLYCESRYSVPFLTSQTAKAETKLPWNTELTNVCQSDLLDPALIVKLVKKCN